MIHMYVCLFVCMYVRMYVCMYVYVSENRSWSQSYDRELQRQRCKKLQRHSQLSVFWKQHYFLTLSNLLQRLRCNCKFRIRRIGPRVEHRIEHEIAVSRSEGVSREWIIELNRDDWCSLSSKVLKVRLKKVVPCESNRLFDSWSVISYIFAKEFRKWIRPSKSKQHFGKKTFRMLILLL
jgi:hypothetical protein